MNTHTHSTGMDKATAEEVYGEMIACRYTAGMSLRLFALNGRYAIASYDRTMPDIAEVMLWYSRQDWQTFVAQCKELEPTM